MKNLSSIILQKWAFYSVTALSALVLISFQNCGKVKFNAQRVAAVVPQSCGTVTMSPQNGIFELTSVTFTATPPAGITISDIQWEFTKGTQTVFTSTNNPVTHTFSGVNEGPGSYLATVTYMKSDGNACELAQSFQVLTNDLCADPSGISGPAVGFVDEETSPFSVNFEVCFQGTVVWDMNSDGIAEYNVGVTDSVTHTYTAPGTYTVTATVINAEDNSQTILTHTIVVNYAACTNGATNPPGCDQCPAGQTLVNGQCVANCTNGATNPPECTQCPAGQTLVNGQCIANCANGANNPPTCNQCAANQVLVNGQCVSNCTNGTTNPPACNQCPAGQTLVNGQCVNNCTNGATNPPACNSCPGGQTLVNGQCTTVVYSWSVGGWSGCSATACGTSGAITRSVVCTANIGGTYPDANCAATPKPPTSEGCSAPACNACALPWGGAVAHGGSVTAYAASSVPCGGACAAETRTCNNGWLSGSYTASGCSAQACPQTGCWTCTDAECSPGPAAGCGYSGYVNAHRATDMRGRACANRGTTLGFQRAIPSTITCDRGWLLCGACP